MAGWIGWSCFLAILFLASSTIASSEGPFIVAHKKVKLTRLKSGSERVSVSVDIYNQGYATAYDVTLNDGGWTLDIFDIVSGNTSTSWERLESGTLLSHSFELEAKTKTMFYGAPAVITFRVPTKAALQVWLCNMVVSSVYVFLYQCHFANVVQCQCLLTVYILGSILNSDPAP
ncbi:translocon-associated subunit beta-like [Olea europaea subsp. europaea]|uniref:Translocon-associated subunit beta-like n=1 Tax=Olea europaea subsp. europaea TaxID=158383 RepID=A0A8S0TJ64_OLEEU|nr:translocon-associated subunit beta-like [Olea europaea subsp. europaea]